MATKTEHVPIGYVDLNVRLRVVAPDGWWQNVPPDLNMSESPEQIYAEATRDAVEAFRDRVRSISTRIPGGAAKLQVCYIQVNNIHEADEIPHEQANFDYDSWDL